VIDELIANNNADPQRIYVCGFSMGGDMAHSGSFSNIQTTLQRLLQWE
jgi:poly(3-hydroxybutyrate) depolymerase